MPKRNSEVCPTFFGCVWFFNYFFDSDGDSGQRYPWKCRQVLVLWETWFWHQDHCYWSFHLIVNRTEIASVLVEKYGSKEAAPPVLILSYTDVGHKHQTTFLSIKKFLFFFAKVFRSGLSFSCLYCIRSFVP